ncbi:helix-turn-helix transcriptional regulator [Methanobrevibacter sp.]|uniref:helix-turn-helix transcriptional regulator n=1 Tax=Methanobrevibacter sp. TaxID=66852 RepID=UPI00386A5B29
MSENKNYLKYYNLVSEDVKFAANSIIRLRILAALFEKPQNMKGLTDLTKLSYSSISSTIHGLELEEFVYRESNKYYLSNSLKMIMVHVLELKDVVNLLNRFFNMFEGHVVRVIPNKSVVELNMICNSDLLESGGIDAYKIYNFIEDALIDANKVRCILPFYHLDLNKQLNCLVNKDKYVEIIVSHEIFEIYEERSESKYLSSFKGKNNFLLIVTDKMMILGLFKENGHFDQNRLLTSKNSDAIRWANNLFKNFKKKNK